VFLSSERCQPTRDALSAYVDGELPPADAEAIADHLTSCAQCSAEYHAVLATVALVRSQLTRYSAPDVLRARIRSSLLTTPPASQVDAGDVPRPTTRFAPRTRWSRVAALAAMIIVAVGLGSGVTLLASGRGRADPTIAAQILSSHVRSLIPDHLTDIRSSDQHNVKPWFNGRLDYSPSVPRFEEQGYPLVGGRVDYVGGRSVAVVVYSRRQHLINVYSWPAAAGGAEGVSSAASNGYTMLHWRTGGIQQWVVSDLNAAELKGFVDLLQHAEAGVAGPPSR
jgi:anti-sigma factor (TIGR02949 family)